MVENKLRILVVDDERAIRHFLQITLGAEGYAVFEASNGREALSQVAANRPDLIILDLGLPDIDGVEVTRFCGRNRRSPSSSCRCATRKRRRLRLWMPAPTTT